MFWSNFVCFLVISTFYTQLNVQAIRTKDKIYETIPSASGCYRRLNGTHQVGCGSERGGSTGVIHYCELQSDLNFILKNGTAPPYVPILPTALFTAENVHKMARSGKVSGVLIYKSDPRDVTSFSHEPTCPNLGSGVENTCGGRNQSDFTWNPLGSGLLREDIPYPVFYIEDSGNLKSAKECFRKHNNHSFNSQRDRSLCSVELLSFMIATSDTPTCLRRSNTLNLNPITFCDPLGDQNVWATMYPLVTDFDKYHNNEKPAPRHFKYIVLATRMDTASMFEVTAGAVTPVTGLVTLLSVAKLLKTLLPQYDDNGHDLNVLYVIFNGETFDYIGSQRLLYDMNNNAFPLDDDEILSKIRMEDIHLFLELSQLNIKEDLVFAHTLSPKNSTLDNFMLTLKKYAKQENLSVTDSRDTLPPASFHTFFKNNSNLPGWVFSDHSREFTNHFYNSIYDNASNINFEYMNISSGDGNVNKNDSIQARIANFTVALTKTLYKEIKGVELGHDLKADIQLVDELLHCYLENANCRVHQAVQRHKLLSQPFSLYVGVERLDGLRRTDSFLTYLVGLTLAWMTGEPINDPNVTCTNQNHPGIQYLNFSVSLDSLNETKCFKATMNFTDAISPAFLIEDYDWKSGLYSSWTESTWNEFNLRLFLKPSAAHENMTIAIGSIVFIFSLLFVYFVKNRSDVLFRPPLPTQAPTNC